MLKPYILIGICLSIFQACEPNQLETEQVQEGDSNKWVCLLPEFSSEDFVYDEGKIPDPSLRPFSQVCASPEFKFVDCISAAQKGSLPLSDLAKVVTRRQVMRAQAAPQSLLGRLFLNMYLADPHQEFRLALMISGIEANVTTYNFWVEVPVQKNHAGVCGDVMLPPPLNRTLVAYVRELLPDFARLFQCNKVIIDNLP